MPVIQIVGAGPGAEDLITVRGMRVLERADFVLYAGSLVNPEILSYCGKDCIIKDSSSMNLEEQVEIMCAYAKQGKNVVRLHTGDPSLFGAINEQIRLLKQYGIAIKIIPGVSSVFAAAAELGIELTAPQISQSVVLTRTAGRTPMPEKEKASDFAKTGATLVFFLSTGNIAELMQDLHVNGGLPLDTPAAVVYRATWEEQQILHGTLEDIAQKADNAGFGRQALIFVGKPCKAMTTPPHQNCMRKIFPMVTEIFYLGNNFTEIASFTLSANKVWRKQKKSCKGFLAPSIPFMRMKKLCPLNKTKSKRLCKAYGRNLTRMFS